MTLFSEVVVKNLFHFKRVINVKNVFLMQFSIFVYIIFLFKIFSLKNLIIWLF